MSLSTYIDHCEHRLKTELYRNSSFSPDYDEGRRDMLTSVIAELKQIVKTPPPKPRPVCTHPNTYREGSLGEFCTNCNMPVD